MEIVSYRDGNEMRIELRGRLDAAWSGNVSKSLQETLHAGCHQVALDLSGVTYLSSAGIRVLVVLAKQLKTIGGQLRIINPSTAVETVLNLIGFQNLLAAEKSAAPSPRQTVESDAPASTAPVSRLWRHGEQSYQLYHLDAGQAVSARLLGNPESVLQGKAALLASHCLDLTQQTVVIGLGAIGETDDALAQAGELLAVNGLAIVRPGCDAAHPDWLASEGSMVAKLNLIYGCQLTGEFSHLLRFGEVEQQAATGLSQLCEAVLALCGDQAVVVMIAETANLVGAGLQIAPQAAGDDLFGFPDIRDKLLFTAEPAYHQETSLIVGILAQNPQTELLAYLRPMAADSRVYGHFHAAVVPYRPVPKGAIDLQDSIDQLMESQTIRDLLHLINDDRAGVGSGESYLQRGAVWCAPLKFARGESA